MSWFTDLFKSVFGIVVKDPVIAAANKPVAGPPEDEHPPVSVFKVIGANWGNVTDPAATKSAPWVNGWWVGAQRTPAHPGRIGASILPKSAVIHTTDMFSSDPDSTASYRALVKQWTTTPGKGNAATFSLGRTPAQGVHQYCPITRNSNHAGGSPHGWFRTKVGGLVHPNTCCVGIELHCAGVLDRTPKGWVHRDSGLRVPDEDVTVDNRGHGWQIPTPYQMATLRQLLVDLEPCLGTWDAGTTVVPNGDYRDNQVPYAVTPSLTVVGHATLDPVNRMDPGPYVMQWLKDSGF